MIDFRVKGRKILIKNVPSKNTSSIIIPDKVEGDIRDYENWLAEVVGIGEKASVECDIKVGDIVMMDPTYQASFFLDPNWVKDESLVGKPYESNKRLSYAFVNYEQILSTITQK